MRFVFNEQKAAEAAAHLLRRAGKPVPYLKLLKLLYLADRDTLIDRGFPITGDKMVAMPKGPVLSNILNRITDGPVPQAPSPWFEYVSPPEGYAVRLLQEPPDEGELSDYELSMLDAVFERYGEVDRWALVELTHELPEWTDPEGSSILIDPADILRHVGKSEEEVAAMVEEAEHMWLVDRRLISRR